MTGPGAGGRREKHGYMARRKNKTRDTHGSLVDVMPGSYWDRTSSPIYALTYLLGFIVLYEFGTIFINPEVLNQSVSSLKGRVIAFLWVQDLLRMMGFYGRTLWIATPSVVIIILIAWQIASKKRWTVNIKDFLPMTVECICLSVPLIVLSLVVNISATAPAEQTAALTGLQEAAIQPHTHTIMVDIVTSIGAGIYEELVFRLMLICLLMIVLQDFANLNRSVSIVLSVLISAMAFSLYHHFSFIDGGFGLLEQFSLPPFIFRTLAGVYFAVLFALRGFGITAGTHAFYDIIAALIKTWAVASVN